MSNEKGIDYMYKFGLYFSSYLPIFLMIFLNNMNNLSLQSLKETLYNNISFWILMLFSLGICLIIMGRFVYFLYGTFKNNTSPVEVNKKELKTNESEIINYFITYLIPILTLDPSKWPSILSNMILIVIVGIYFVKNNLLTFNILLLICNFRIYKDEYSNIYITKCSFLDIKTNNTIAYRYGTSSNIFFIFNKKKLKDLNE